MSGCSLAMLGGLSSFDGRISGYIERGICICFFGAVEGSTKDRGDLMIV